MLHDLVLDTNVLVHASNPDCQFHAACGDLLTRLLEVATSLCVDDGFSLIEADNRSLIGHEYLQHLRFGMVGFAVVSHLAGTGRVRMVSKAVNASLSKRLNILIPVKRDRTFVKVAANSEERVLGSHDFADFSVGVRKELLGSAKVRILAAAEVAAEL